MEEEGLFKRRKRRRTTEELRFEKHSNIENQRHIDKFMAAGSARLEQVHKDMPDTIVASGETVDGGGGHTEVGTGNPCCQFSHLVI